MPAACLPGPLRLPHSEAGSAGSAGSGGCSQSAACRHRGQGLLEGRLTSCWNAHELPAGRRLHSVAVVLSRAAPPGQWQRSCRKRHVQKHCSMREQVSRPRGAAPPLTPAALPATHSHNARCGAATACESCTGLAAKVRPHAAMCLQLRWQAWFLYCVNSVYKLQEKHSQF
jgi:hypothetical protein